MQNNTPLSERLRRVLEELELILKETEQVRQDA